MPDIVVLVVGDYGSAEFNGLELDNGSSYTQLLLFISNESVPKIIISSITKCIF